MPTYFYYIIYTFITTMIYSYKQFKEILILICTLIVLGTSFENKLINDF